jgi:Flp pilus assembly protein TadD
LKLAIILLESGRDAEAEEQLRGLFELERRAGRRLDAAATSTAHYLLAVAAAKHGRFQEARVNIDTAMRLDATNSGARDLRDQIDAYEREHRPLR